MKVVMKILCFFGLHDWDMVFKDERSLDYTIECYHCKKVREQTRCGH